MAVVELSGVESVWREAGEPVCLCLPCLAWVSTRCTVVRSVAKVDMVGHLNTGCVLIGRFGLQ